MFVSVAPTNEPDKIISIIHLYYNMAKIISLNIGLPRQVIFNGQVVTTGIYKEPTERHVILRQLNLDGDKQADLTVHGGIDKAVYAYAMEHYDYWKEELPDVNLPWGMFGENFTTEGLLEDDVNIGDTLRVGSARLMVTQPRMPCYKLGVRFGRMDIVRRFMAGGRPGIYFKVLEEGEVTKGDEINIIRRDKNNVTVRDIVRIYIRDHEDIKTMKRAVKIEALPEGWKYEFQQKINELEKR
jgi:MOSC domain-containing protein YiiM